MRHLRTRSSKADSGKRGSRDSPTPPQVDIVLLLGRRDFPTDGVDDYSHHLATALRNRGHSVDILICDWEGQGWLRGLITLRAMLRASGSRLVLMQYTHLIWSRHGFPHMAIPVAWSIKRTGATLGIVIHDPVAYSGARIRDRIRRSIQLAVMRALVHLASGVVVPTPLSSLTWLPSPERSVRLIPVGSNVGHSLVERSGAEADTFTIVVFGVTERNARQIQELGAIVGEVAAQIGLVRLVLLGRGSREAQPSVERLLSDSMVRISVLGIVPASEIGSWLSVADVALFIRGGISSRRGTAVAAIAHGLPLVAYEGAETGWPLTDAGVVLVPEGDTQAMIQALVQLAQDRTLAEGLRARSRAAFDEHFAWERIAQRFEELFLS